MAWKDRSAVKPQLNSLLILVESPFGAYDAERFDIDRLAQMLDVVVIDITPLVKPDYWNLYRDRAIPHPNIRVATSWESVASILSSRSWHAWIDELGVSGTAQRIRRRLRRARCARVRIRLGLLPGDFIIKSNAKARLAARRSQLGVFGVVRNLVLYLPRRIATRIPAPDLVLGSGSFTERDVPAGSTIIWAHSFDYEKAFVERESGSQRPKYAAVFLDQNLGYHPDQLHSGIQSPVDVDSYYEGIRKVFDRVESVIGGRVTVAVHPKSSFADTTSIFGGREGVRAGAQTLVGTTELVLCHASASLSYAVIWRKPVLFLTSDDLDKSWYKSHIQEMARILNRPVLNIDTLERVTSVQLEAMIRQPVEEQRYKEYEEQFIKSKFSGDGRLWQLFADGLNAYVAARH